MMNKKNLILLIASMGVFVEALDIAIVNLALPLIEQSFDLSPDQSYRLQSFYVLIYGGFLILGGKLSDVYGRKRIFLTGALLFLLTSLGAGLSTTYPLLLFFRAVQGLGAALIMPSAFAICNYYFSEPAERSRAIGIFSSFAAIGSGSGLAVGGIIASYLGWSWVFLINVPVLLLVLLVGYVCLEKDEARRATTPDIRSAIALITAMFALTWTLEALPHLAVRPENVLLPLLVCLVSSRYLYGRLKHEPNPLLDTRLFSIHSLRLGNLLFIFLGVFFTGYLFLISYILQHRFSVSAARAGLLLVPFSVLSALVARFLIPWLSDRWSARVVAGQGTACMLLGAVLLFLGIRFSSLPVLLAGGALIAGVGMPLCFTGFSVTAMSEVPPQNLGLGSSLTTTAYFTGGGLGLPLLSFLLNRSGTSSSGGGEAILLLAAVALASLLILAGSGKRATVLS